MQISHEHITKLANYVHFYHRAMIHLIFWLMQYVKITTLLLSPTNVIDAVQSEGNLNQITSLWRKITIIANGHVGSLQDYSPTNQLAVSQVADWITRGLVNLPTANFKIMELLYFICTLNLTLSNIGRV